MTESEIKAAVFRDHANDDVPLYIRRLTGSGVARSASCLTENGWREIAHGDRYIPSVRLTHAEAKALAESLHAAGIRLDSELQSGGHRTALEAHLADMRQLAFAGLKVSKPESVRGS